MRKLRADAPGMFSGGKPRPFPHLLAFPGPLLLVIAFLTLLVTSAGARAQQQPTPPSGATATPQSQPQLATGVGGALSGKVLYEDGSVLVGAQVSLSAAGQAQAQQTDVNGQFSFSDVPAGPFQLKISASGFTDQTVAGTLHPGEALAEPSIKMTLAPNVTSVQVVAPNSQIAEAQVKAEETQRVLGIVPNFYVSYFPDAAPLNSKQKFQLAWRSSIDPVTFAVAAGFAGFEQEENAFSGYGQGAQGYAKRFGASYADTAIGTFIGGAILPSVLRQDPRYFYKGTGSVRSRLFYAIANAFICKGDNKHWQPNYSNILGDLAAGGISNLYYPPQNRNGAALTFESGLIGIGATAAANILEEFVMRKLTPNLPNYGKSKS